MEAMSKLARRWLSSWATRRHSLNWHVGLAASALKRRDASRGRVCSMSQRATRSLSRLCSRLTSSSSHSFNRRVIEGGKTESEQDPVHHLAMRCLANFEPLCPSVPLTHSRANDKSPSPPLLAAALRERIRWKKVGG